MKIRMTPKQITKIIKNHKLWLETNGEYGEKANSDKYEYIVKNIILSTDRGLRWQKRIRKQKLFELRTGKIKLKSGMSFFTKIIRFYFWEDRKKKVFEIGILKFQIAIAKYKKKK